MKNLFFVLCYLICSPVWAQIMFVERTEVEAAYLEKDFTVIPFSTGLIAFRTQPEKGFNLKANLQFFTTDFSLQAGEVQEIRLRDNYDLVGYDIEGDYFYALLQKGTANNADKYLISIELSSMQSEEYTVENIYSMELQEFFVLNRFAVFMGTNELKPIIQIYDINENTVFTVESIYSRDTKILQLRKDSELGILDVLISRRDRYKNKIISLLSFDESGNKLRDVLIDKLEDEEVELVEGILTPIHNYQQSLIGAYGHRKRESFYGIYLAEINEFGGYKIKYLTLEDFPNFYNYLNERQREKKLKELEKYYSKEKRPVIRPVFSTREVINTEKGFLVYSDNFIANNPRYMPRDGVYANDAYRFNPNRMFFPGGMGTMYGPYRYWPTFPGNWRTEGEYKFVSAHMSYLDRSGNVLWENSLNLANKITGASQKFGEVSFDGEKLHYLYLDELNIMMSYIDRGEVVFENQSFEIQLVDDSQRIRDTQENSLSLAWWYGDYFLLTGKQKVRLINSSGRDETKEVFFITKIKVDGDQFVPEEPIEKNKQKLKIKE
jgi:hypothetical protein